MTSLEKMKAEAILRMRSLKLNSIVLQNFTTNEQIYYSFGNFGFLYPLDKAMEERVRRFEKKYGYLVYHVIDNPTSIGRMHSYLYVSSNEEEWEQDQQDLKDGCPIVYVENVDDEILSEFGSIGIQPRSGGVIRTA
nr:MAG TPA: hypothetical protein [Caudoviricetes sp.]